MKTTAHKRKHAQSKSIKRKGKKLSSDMFDLVDVEEISKLNRNFTACIVELPLKEIYGRESEIFELVAQQIEPLLVPGAFVIVKASSDACPAAHLAFTNNEFQYRSMLISTRGKFYEPWLVFQNTFGHKSHPNYSKFVFESSNLSEEETSICNDFDRDNGFSPQSLLREFVKLLCPEPIISHVLVPYFRNGTAVAACKAAGVRSVGYDSKEYYCEQGHFLNMADIIERLAEIEA